MTLPACDAVMVHDPGERIVIVAPLGPLALHAPDAANVTGFPDAPPVALTAQVQPLQLPVPAALSLPSQLPGLIAQQVSFNTGVAVDFVVTGAELIGQQIQVAQRLVNDIRNGTPIPVAVGPAVVGFINIEVVAGPDLVGLGTALVNSCSRKPFPQHTSRIRSPGLRP